MKPAEAEAAALRILIVDVDAKHVEALTRQLPPAEYAVATARQASDALRALFDPGADVVILDRAAADTSSLDLCRSIRAEKAIPFVYILLLMPGPIDEASVVEAFEAGVNDLLRKDAGQRELVARLRPAWRMAALQKELAQRKMDMHRYNAEIAHANRKLEESNWKLRHAATTDELTALANRRAAFARLNELWVSSERYKHGLVCIAIDVDHFKTINDTHGHAVGDRVLRETAQTLQKVTRKNETLCRIGGEEFLVLCPHAEEAEAAVGAERMRRAVENGTVHVGDLELRVTISVGVAGRAPAMSRPDDLVRAADDALYAAKAAGRNKVCTAGGHARCDAVPAGVPQG